MILKLLFHKMKSTIDFLLVIEAVKKLSHHIPIILADAGAFRSTAPDMLKICFS